MEECVFFVCVNGYYVCSVYALLVRVKVYVFECVSMCKRVSFYTKSAFSIFCVCFVFCVCSVYALLVCVKVCVCF